MENSVGKFDSFHCPLIQFYTFYLMRNILKSVYRNMFAVNLKFPGKTARYSQHISCCNYNLEEPFFGKGQNCNSK
jgi:hypothetical protein